MKIGTMRVTCSKGHVSDVQIVVECPIEVAAASMRAATCPECGSGELGLGGNHGDAPGLHKPLEVRALWWRHRGEHGVSAATIYTAYAKKPHSFFAGSTFCYPHDPDDFRRCKQLFDLLPEWRADLTPLVERFPWFKPHADRWAEFERLYAEEAPTGKAPKLYVLMRQTAVKADLIRLHGGTNE